MPRSRFHQFGRRLESGLAAAYVLRFAFYASFSRRLGLAVASALLLLLSVSPLRAQTPAAEEGFVSLFDGRTLNGWRVGDNGALFQVRDGMIVMECSATAPSPAHLFYEGEVNGHNFKDFDLRVDVMTYPSANSGIYFHTKFQQAGFPKFGIECQVNNSHSDWRRTGSLWGIQNVTWGPETPPADNKEKVSALPNPPVTDNVWYTQEIICRNGAVTVKLNGKTLLEYQVPQSDTEHALPSGMTWLPQGTFALQGHPPMTGRACKTCFKNIRVKVLAADSAAQAQTAPASGKLDRAKLPGRQVKFSTIAIGFDGNHDEKLKLAIEELEIAGKNGVDAACLPEEFAGTRAEPIPGPTTTAVAELAKKYSMYVVCPIREQAGSEQYNTAVLIDRQGNVAGYYRKVFVFWGECLNVSREGVKTFDTDFGKVSILTCFDANYPELWQEANNQKAEVVFWPSAYGGGQPLNAYAALYHYCIVAVGWGNLLDPITGKDIQTCQKVSPHQFIGTVDLDQVLVHKDFTDAKVARLLKEHEGEVALDERFNTKLNPENWYLLKALKPGVRVRELLKQYDIEPLREYQLRSRKEINEIRAKGGKV